MSITLQNKPMIRRLVDEKEKMLAEGIFSQYLFRFMRQGIVGASHICRFLTGENSYPTELTGDALKTVCTKTR